MVKYAQLGRVRLADGGDHHGVDQGGDGTAVHHARRLLELRPVGEAHPGVVGAHLLQHQAHERREVRAVPSLRELRPAVGERLLDRREPTRVQWLHRGNVGRSVTRDRTGAPVRSFLPCLITIAAD